MNKTAAFSSVILVATRFIVILLSVLTLLFLLQRMTGDPVTAMVGNTASPETVAAIREDLGLDRSLPIQYLAFLSNAIQMDFGESLRFQQPALQLVLSRVPATLMLAFSSLVLAVGIGVPLGIYAAVYRYRFDGRLINIMAGIMQSLPPFWLGLVLLLIFSVRFHWFSSVASLEENPIKRLILPAITLSAVYMARLTRMVRSGLMDELSQPYVLTARSKGLNPRVVFFIHVFRNTLIPIVAFVTLDLSLLVGGSVVVENLFSYSGIGDQMVKAIFNRDYPVVQATVFVVTLLVICINLFSSYLYRVLDPRLSSQAPQ
jgi:peptide/nickel transport system permease protein